MSKTNFSREANMKSPSRSSDEMPSALHSMPTIGCEWCVGILQKDCQGLLLVSSGGWRAKAKVAVSCLLEPEQGDSVVCLKVAPDQVWVMSILSREDSVVNHLKLRGESRIQVEGGALNLQADELVIRSKKFEMGSEQAAICVDTGQLISRKVQVTSGTIKLVGSVMTTVMERIQQFSQSYLRTTDGSDQVNAGYVKMQAKHLMQLDAEHTLVSGKNLVKARGAQIHFG